MLSDKGYLLSIASSRSHRSLMEFIENMGLQEVLTYVLGADDVVQAKPHPEPVLKTLEKFGCRADEALVVGDSTYDMDMGRGADCDLCGVSFGSHTPEMLRRTGARYIIDHFSELGKIVLG